MLTTTTTTKKKKKLHISLIECAGQGKSLFTLFQTIVLILVAILPNQLGLLNTLTAPLQRGKTPPPTSVLDMTLNN